MGSEARKSKTGNVTDHSTTHRDVFAVRVTIVTVETQRCVPRVVEMHITVNYIKGKGKGHSRTGHEGPEGK